MFGINPAEFIVLVAVAAVVLGPERLPEYAASLARLVRELRRMAQGASAQVRDELGPEFDDIDWRKLDPRQYDPRRIVREALADVWDPDDPLGLKEGNRPAQSEDDVIDEKPVSPGGPTSSSWAADQDSNGTSVNGTSGYGTSVNGTAGSDAEAGTDADLRPPPVFDPDAT